MAEILERLIRVETTLEKQDEVLRDHGDTLKNLDQKLDDVHAFIFTSKGAEAARQAIAEQQLNRNTRHHFISVGISGFVGAVAGVVASIIAFLNRVSPAIN